MFKVDNKPKAICSSCGKQVSLFKAAIGSSVMVYGVHFDGSGKICKESHMPIESK